MSAARTKRIVEHLLLLGRVASLAAGHIGTASAVASIKANWRFWTGQ
jgi:hypothetical protein